MEPGGTAVGRPGECGGSMAVQHGRGKPEQRAVPVQRAWGTDRGP
jgi:hypothetical protein